MSKWGSSSCNYEKCRTSATERASVGVFKRGKMLATSPAFQNANRVSAEHMLEKEFAVKLAEKCGPMAAMRVANIKIRVAGVDTFVPRSMFTLVRDVCFSIDWAWTWHKGGG